MHSNSWCFYSAVAGWDRTGFTVYWLITLSLCHVTWQISALQCSGPAHRLEHVQARHQLDRPPQRSGTQLLSRQPLDSGAQSQTATRETRCFYKIDHETASLARVIWGRQIADLTHVHQKKDCNTQLCLEHGAYSWTVVRCGSCQGALPV